MRKFICVTLVMLMAIGGMSSAFASTEPYFETVGLDGDVVVSVMGSADVTDVQIGVDELAEERSLTLRATGFRIAPQWARITFVDGWGFQGNVYIADRNHNLLSGPFWVDTRSGPHTVDVWVGNNTTVIAWHSQSIGIWIDLGTLGTRDTEYVE